MGKAHIGREIDEDLLSKLGTKFRSKSCSNFENRPDRVIEAVETFERLLAFFRRPSYINRVYELQTGAELR